MHFAWSQLWHKANTGTTWYSSIDLDITAWCCTSKASHIFGYMMLYGCIHCYWAKKTLLLCNSAAQHHSQIENATHQKGCIQCPWKVLRPRHVANDRWCYWNQCKCSQTCRKSLRMPGHYAWIQLLWSVNTSCNGILCSNQVCHTIGCNQVGSSRAIHGILS